MQVLFRLELHWLLARQDDQKKIEEEMLVHLRQISIWDSPNQMLTFLQVTMLPENFQPGIFRGFFLQFHSSIIQLKKRTFNSLNTHIEI